MPRNSNSGWVIYDEVVVDPTREVTLRVTSPTVDPTVDQYWVSNSVPDPLTVGVSHETFTLTESGPITLSQLQNSSISRQRRDVSETETFRQQLERAQRMAEERSRTEQREAAAQRAWEAIWSRTTPYGNPPLSGRALRIAEQHVKEAEAAAKPYKKEEDKERCW